MIRRFQLFLGPARLRTLFILFAITGLASLMLNAVVNQYDWVRRVQSLLLLVFIAGAAVIIGGQLRPDERGRWLSVLIPAFIAIFIGLIIVPQYSTILIGASLGWIVAGLFLTRSRMPMEYRDAVKHLRKLEYGETIQIMDRVIKMEPRDPKHYGFRAEVFRVWGKLGQALRDYQKMTQLAPDSPIAQNGLAEVYLQRGEYPQAHEAALKANQLAPKDWVTFYNLGMIEDRLNLSDQVIAHLQKALALKVKDSRHRVLIYLYLARAYSRLGQLESAAEQVALIKRQSDGLSEWQTILDDKQADTLRTVLGDDIAAAQDLVNGKLDLTDLAEV